MTRIHRWAIGTLSVAFLTVGAARFLQAEADDGKTPKPTASPDSSTEGNATAPASQASAGEAKPIDASAGEPKPVDFDIHGMKIGDPMTDDFVARYINPSRENPSRENPSRENPSRENPSRDKLRLRNPERTLQETIILKSGGLNVFYVMSDDRLAYVDIMFPSAIFPIVVKSYAEKFGAEPKTARMTLKNGAGEPYDTETATWVTNDGPFEILEFNGTPQKSMFSGMRGGMFGDQSKNPTDKDTPLGDGGMRAGMFGSKSGGGMGGIGPEVPLKFGHAIIKSKPYDERGVISEAKEVARLKSKL